jgi:hypothetical protein
MTGDESLVGDRRIRKFPSKVGARRGVRVEIHSWVGVSAGASHYCVRIKADPNLLWSEKEGAWIQLYVDTGADDTFSLDEAKVLTERDAVKVATAFLKTVMTPEYYLDWCDEVCPCPKSLRQYL